MTSARLFCMLLLVSPALAANAQTRGGARISGVITDGTTGDPVPNAHVFISGSTSGTVTDSDGKYELSGVPLGANRLVISSVGFLRQGHDFVVRRPIGFALDFVLDRRVVALGEIVVTGERSAEWDRHLEEFTVDFLGLGPNAAKSRILNPEVLDFESVDGNLVAIADEPIEVENEALGYRILYFLRGFIREGEETRQEGEALFAELVPGDQEERDAWDTARKQAYLGSSRHFFRSLFSGRTRDVGFYIYSSERPRPPQQDTPFRQNRAAPFRRPQFALEPAGLVHAGAGPRERLVSFQDFVEIVYTRERESRAYRAWQGLSAPARDDWQRSWITLAKDSVIVDSDGSVLDPYGVRYYGYMAFERVADMVPKEFVAN